MNTDVALVQVRLLGVPVGLRAQSVEHGEGLVRELTLVHLGADRGDTEVPGRLLDVAQELRTTYGAFTAGPSAEFDAALEQGVERLDVTYTVPDGTAAFVARLTRALDDAEDFCRQGRYLLSIAPPPEVVAYRRWSLGEFERQLGGLAPTPWDEYANR